VIPRVPASGSVIAIVTYHRATPAFVIHDFAPSITYSPSFFTARVFWFAASEPDWGSVSA
jgi:hypothetical protein